MNEETREPVKEQELGDLEVQDEQADAVKGGAAPISDGPIKATPISDAPKK